MDIWKTLGGEPSLVPAVLDHLVNLLNVSLPYQEKVNPKDQTTTRTATVLAMSVRPSREAGEVLVSCL